MSEGSEPRHDAPPPRPRDGRPSWALPALVLGLIVPAIGMLLLYRSCKDSTARGQLAVDGTGLGTWRYPLVSCTQPPGSVAEVLLAKDDDAVLTRVYYDRGQPMIELREPSGNRTLAVGPSGCARFAINPRVAADAPGGPDLSTGSLFVDCKLPAGGRVTIDAWWQRCAAPE